MSGAPGAYGSPLNGATPFEGAFVFPPDEYQRSNPYPTVIAGQGGAVGAVDVIVSRFAWFDAYTGTVTNVRRNSTDRLGFVGPVYGNWQRVYCQGGLWYARSGLPLTLFAGGAFWARFANGAQAAQPVYASSVDGSAICGYASEAELTPWSTRTACTPGSLAIITTF